MGLNELLHVDHLKQDLAVSEPDISIIFNI